MLHLDSLGMSSSVYYDDPIGYLYRRIWGDSGLSAEQFLVTQALNGDYNHNNISWESMKQDFATSGSGFYIPRYLRTEFLFTAINLLKSSGEQIDEAHLRGFFINFIDMMRDEFSMSPSKLILPVFPHKNNSNPLLILEKSKEGLVFYTPSKAVHKVATTPGCSEAHEYFFSLLDYSGVTLSLEDMIYRNVKGMAETELDEILSLLTRGLLSYAPVKAYNYSVVGANHNFRFETMENKFLFAKLYTPGRVLNAHVKCDLEKEAYYRLDSLPAKYKNLIPTLNILTHRSENFALSVLTDINVVKRPEVSVREAMDFYAYMIYNLNNPKLEAPPLDFPSFSQIIENIDFQGVSTSKFRALSPLYDSAVQILSNSSVAVDLDRWMNFENFHFFDFDSVRMADVAGLFPLALLDLGLSKRQEKYSAIDRFLSTSFLINPSASYITSTSALLQKVIEVEPACYLKELSLGRKTRNDYSRKNALVDALGIRL